MEEKQKVTREEALMMVWKGLNRLGSHAVCDLCFEMGFSASIQDLLRTLGANNLEISQLELMQGEIYGKKHE